MAFFSNVACAEEHGSQSENVSEDVWSCSVVLRCGYLDRYFLVEDILGSRREWPYHSNPIRPRAKTATIAPAADSALQVGQGYQYQHALVTINYETKGDTEEEDLLSEEIEPTAEFLKLDHKLFRWGAGEGDPLLEAEAPGRLIKGMNLVRTRFKVEGTLPSALIDLVGSCNKNSYTSNLLGITFPETTLLYNPPKLNRTITTEGIGAWNVIGRFTYKSQGWNKFWRPETQEYESIYIAGGDEYKSHPEEDWSALIGL